MNEPAHEILDRPSSVYNIEIIELNHELTEPLVSIIRKSLDPFEEAGSLLAASFRRLKSFYDSYQRPGCKYYVAYDPKIGAAIGGVGLGPLAGLPPTEGLGEVREMVIEKEYRHQGLGGRLLKQCLEEASRFGYKRLYLSTTPTMEPAQRLFLRFGFKPVRDGTGHDPEVKIPCYFTLEMK